MGVPVAKPRGMKTGVPGHSDLEATSTGNETRFSSTRPFWRRASSREGIAAQQSRRICRGRCRTIANEPADVLVVRMQPRRTRSMPPINFGGAIASDLPKRNRERHPREGCAARRGPPFFFERGLRPTKTPCATSATSMVECTTAWREIAHRAIGEGTTPAPRTHGA